MNKDFRGMECSWGTDSGMVYNGAGIKEMCHFMFGSCTDKTRQKKEEK